MLEKIKLGNPIHVKVPKSPTSAAAAKTLVRLLSKDVAAKAETKRQLLLRERHNRVKIRGGRTWTVRLIKFRPLKGVVGESGTILATYDVMAALRSVLRFIEVTKA